MKSFTDEGRKRNCAVVKGVRGSTSLVDKSDIGGTPSSRSSANKQGFIVQSSEKIMSTGKVH